jgi:hypothetical protein
MDLNAFVGKLLADDDQDTLREGVRVLAQALMDAEVSAKIGAGPTSAARSGPRIATATERDAGTRVSASVGLALTRRNRAARLMPAPAQFTPRGRRGHALRRVASRRKRCGYRQ